MNLQEFFNTADSPTSITRGVVYNRIDTTLELNKKDPLYIVDIIDEGDQKVASVFRAMKQTLPPTKAFHTKKEVHKFETSTILSRLASSLSKPIEKKNILVEPPLFLEVVTEGKDTFSGFYGAGFFERAQDSFLPDGSTSKGAYTGVFITLNSIEWLSINFDLNKLISEYQVNREIWFPEGLE